MIVRLKRKNARYRELTFGQSYAVIGIEGDDLRILNDAGRPFLYPPDLFSLVVDREPIDSVTEFGDDGERYSYPPPLNKSGFFEDFFDQKAQAVATFWRAVINCLRLINGEFCTASGRVQRADVSRNPSVNDHNFSNRLTS